MNPALVPFPNSHHNLDQIFLELAGLFDSRAKLTQFPQNPAYKQDFDFYSAEITRFDNRIREKLTMLLNFPPCHSRHFDKLNIFHRDAGYEESVFIMTKFPEGNGSADLELVRIINSVVSAVKNCGFCPRIASDSQYHSQLWDNVEIYLLGCSKGIAIVEDRYKPELNPNVAMEWGWMRGMGKNVLYLVEDRFTHNRADWSGLMEERFKWDDPDEAIEYAINKWLKV